MTGQRWLVAFACGAVCFLAGALTLLATILYLAMFAQPGN